MRNSSRGVNFNILSLMEQNHILMPMRLGQQLVEYNNVSKVNLELERAQIYQARAGLGY